jgi:hypothetical protein
MSSASTKQLHVDWLRAAATFSHVHQQLEEEIQRMRERKLSQDLIDKKDLQVEALVTFFNQTDELMQAYKLALANARIENHFLTDILARKVSIDEIIKYKPSAQVFIVNDQTAEHKTLTDLNG